MRSSSREMDKMKNGCHINRIQIRLVLNRVKWRGVVNTVIILK
jgi:hypothetical protein